jgi:hypothetical protein
MHLLLLRELMRLHLRLLRLRLRLLLLRLIRRNLLGVLVLLLEPTREYVRVTHVNMLGSHKSIC